MIRFEELDAEWDEIGDEELDVSAQLGLPEGTSWMRFTNYMRTVDGRMYLYAVQQL